MEMPRFASVGTEPRPREAPLELPANATSLDLLRIIYRSPEVPLPVRIRCAMACLQYEHPRLAVVAQISESSFAEVLERRLRNLERISNGNAKMIETG
jgi:hypothetical protein